MKINIEELKLFLARGTFSYNIPFIHLNFKDKRVTSSLSTPEGNVIVYQNKRNNIISGDFDEEITLNFSDPQNNMRPYIEFFEEPEADINIFDNRIDISSNGQKIKLFQSVPNENMIMPNNNPPELDNFYGGVLGDRLFNEMKKMRKVASKHGKIYLTVQNEKLYIEATDKENAFSNSVRFRIGSVEMFDISLMFPVNNFNGLMQVIDEPEDFSFEVSYIEERQGGVVSVEKTDKSERYFLLSCSE